MKNISRFLTLAASLALLASCGGGERSNCVGAGSAQQATAATLQAAASDNCHAPQFSVTASTTTQFSYSFDASATRYQPIVRSYAWDFGDGATASGVSATHTYSNGGSYTVTLSVLYLDGIQQTISQTIGGPAPPPSLVQ